MFIRNLTYIAVLALLFSCSGSDKSVTMSDADMTETDNKSMSDNLTVDENSDTVSLKYKFDKHSVTIQLNEAEMKVGTVSDAKIQMLKEWWDSLPQPLQEQIKSQEVEIELVSNLLTQKNNDLNPEITDSRIENTGAALEKIIGESAEMTFTVKTRQLEKNDNSVSSASTNIVPYIKLPTGLAQFSTTITPGKEGVHSQNLRDLQYWWLNLPEDLKSMIQNNEVTVELNCVAIDKGIEFRKNDRLGENSDEYLFLVNQYLQNMIGFKKMSKKNLPLGSVKMNSQIEKVNANQSADYIIRINLRNKQNLKPSA